MKRPGYYVEGTHFGDKFHQARARAAHLSQEYGRDISVMYLAPEDVFHTNTSVPYEVTRVYNQNRRSA